MDSASCSACSVNERLIVTHDLKKALLPRYQKNHSSEILQLQVIFR